MSTSNDTNSNRGTLADSSPAGALPTQVISPVNRRVVTKFQLQIAALGVFWIIIGAAVIGVGATAAGILPDVLDIVDISPGNSFLAAGFVAYGITWVAIGILSCMKQIWAVYVGLIGTYLSLASQLIQLNLCPVVILIIVLLQAHRVIAWANGMQRLGIPLTAHPSQFTLATECNVDQFAPIAITDAAAEHDKQTIIERFPLGTALRLSVDRSAESSLRVEFDMPVSGSGDWVTEAEGLQILASPHIAAEVQGSTIDVADGLLIARDQRNAT